MHKLSKYIHTQDEKHQSLLAYWIKDYVRFLQKEDSFDPQKLIRYKRGSIVKTHLGYRIGSEEGGLHYAVVIDANNNRSANTVTIIPLTSVKPTTNVNALPPTKVYLGNEVYQRLQEKIDQANSDISNALTTLAEHSKLLDTPLDVAVDQDEWDTMVSKIEKLSTTAAHLNRMQKEIAKMKTGSIALVDQITTISKIRIYDPLYPSDTLAKIRISPESLDKLDMKIKELFTYSK